MPDPVERWALGLMCLIALSIAGLGYWGSMMGASMDGTDALVEEHAAELAQLEPTNPISLSDTGEVVGFTTAGILGGLIVGYLWPSVFERRDVS